MKSSHRFSPQRTIMLSVALCSASLVCGASPQAYILDESRFDASVFIDPEIDSATDYELGYGSAVALDGNRLIVGMPLAPEPDFEDDPRWGRIFIRERLTTGEWTERDSGLNLISAFPDDEGDFFTIEPTQFGRALDADSGYLLVSIKEEQFPGVTRGVVLATWNTSELDYTPAARFYRPINDVGDASADFGAAVQVSAQHTIVGAPGLLNQSNPALPTGGIFVTSTQSLITAEDLEATNPLRSPSQEEGGRFGHALALSGNLLVVGAPGEDVGTIDGAGRAHVFEYSANQWNLLATLDADTPIGDAQYGYSCDIVTEGNETVIVIGAPADTDADRSGLVEVWRRVGTNPFIREAILTDEDAIDQTTETRLPFSSFGFSVKALDKNNIVIGRVNSYDLRNDNQHDPDPGSEAFVDATSGTTAYPYALEPSAFVFRYDDIASEWDVHRPLVPSRVNTTRSWTGWSMDAVSDGDGGFIVALGDPLSSTLQPGLGSAFLFDAFANPIDDFDEFGVAGSDGTSDAWQIKQDIADGFANRLDLNGDGRVDLAPTTSECLRQIVLIVDTSESTTDQPSYYNQVFSLAEKLVDLFPEGEVEVTVLGIGVPFASSDGSQTVDGQTSDYSTIVPRRNNDPSGIDPDPDWVPVLPSITVEGSPGTIRKTGIRFLFERSEFALNDDEENWGIATAIVAEHFPWRSSYRVIVPISDEPGFLGALEGTFGGPPPARDEAFCVMQNANGVAERNGVKVFPLITPYELDSALIPLPSAVQCAEILTGEIIGFTFPTICPAETLYDIGKYIYVSDKSLLSEQGDQSVELGTINLADYLLNPAEVAPPIACDPGNPECPDATGDGLVNLADLNLVLANFGQQVDEWQDGDVNGDGQVNLQDLNLILANFGTDCEEIEKTFSMSLTDPQEIPVTTWLLLRDYPNAEVWLQHLQVFTPEEQEQDTSDLKEWVDDWEAASPE